jgi:tRNA (guanine-N7-)-methyltransferase
VGAPRSRERAALRLRLSDREAGATRNRRIVYGRRRGRRLRPGQRERLAAALGTVQFELPESSQFDPGTLFPQPYSDYWLEIGFGAGEHLAEQAAQHGETGFLGCEVYENGVVRLLGEIERLSLANVRVFTDDARLLLRALPDHSLGRVFILFPDPWPKLRHHKRRMVAPQTLDQLARTMRPGAELRLATDDVGYLRAMLEWVPMHPEFHWLAKSATDWRRRTEDWPQTRYERKAIAAGRTPFFLRFVRRGPSD